MALISVRSRISLELFVQYHLTDLSAVEIGQKIGRVGGEDYLILGRQPVEYPAADLLKAGMEKYFRILDHDDAGQILFDLGVGLQKGK